ncbi:unnamed protein product [Trichobilharzia regenti]|nr:unnamed protein product [Trichobilharzia regenti]
MSGDTKTVENQQQVEDEYLKGFTDLSPSGDRGILKKVLREGTSEVKPCDGDTVVVHYVGTYYGGDENGKVFDSSRARNEKFEFSIGKGDVIKAWDIGVATMKLGEVCELIAAPEYAYHDGKTLKFEVEIFDTLGSCDVSRRKDGSIRKSILRKGRDIHNPVAGAEATILFRNLTESTGDVEVTYCVGNPTPQVPLELDLALRHMNTDEYSRVVVLTEKDSASDGGTDQSRVIYELTLKSFEKVRKGQRLLEGLFRFYRLRQDSKFDPALELYKRLDDDLQYIIANGPKEQTELSEMIVAVRLNSALAYLKLDEPDKCIEFCKKVLDMFASNEKALFRMGQVDHEEAAVYFRRIVAKNPSNTLAVKQLQVCEEAVKKTGLGDVEEKENGGISTDEKSAL